ncbi:MAG: cache domain-containing protein, partial [Fimbriimonadales bacterium]|nr:cache domain-containing protein [Fimbriimonadales bacterium]
MRRLGLRERLLIFYALMALAPVLLSGGLLYAYLNVQVSHSASQFQEGVRQELESYQRGVREGVATVLRDSQRDVRQRVRTQLQAHHRQALQQQTSLLRETVAELQSTTRDALRQTERDTLQNLTQTLNRVEQRVQSVQERSLSSLQATTAAATREALQQIIATHLAQLSAQLSRQVESLLRNYTAQLTLIAQQPAIQNASLQESRWILQALQDREPSYQALALLDSEGSVLLTIGAMPDDSEQAQKDRDALWEQMLAEQETTLGEARLYEVEGQPTPLVPVIAPVRQMGKAFRGAVFALIRLDEASALTRSFRIGERSAIALVQHDGLILAHSDPKQVGKTETRFWEMLRTLRQAQSQLVSLSQGEEILLAAAPVRRLRAILVISQPAAEAFQLATELQRSLARSFERQRAETARTLRQTHTAAQTRFERQMSQHQRDAYARIQHAEQRALARSTHTLQQLAHTQQQSLSTMLAQSTRATQADLERGLAARLNRVFENADRRLAMVAGELRASINERVRTSFLTATLCVLALLMVGAVFLHRTLVRPLRALVKATHDIAAGDLTRRVELPYRGVPDLDDLADSFNHMVDAVQRAEAQLIQSSKLASLGTLASGVAHELNQPLAIIRALAQQNLETLAQPEASVELHRESLQEDLQIIHRQTVRMSQIIQHLRAFARKPREEFEPVNLNEVAQNALVLLREQLRQRGITLMENYAAELPTVLGEANSLEQIVINLLTNARDALEGQDGGQIVIQTGT